MKKKQWRQGGPTAFKETDEYKSFMAHVGRTCRAHRLALGITLRDGAEIAGFKKVKTYMALEAGHMALTITRAVRISKVLAIPLNEFIWPGIGHNERRNRKWKQRLRERDEDAPVPGDEPSSVTAVRSDDIPVRRRRAAA